MAGRGKVEPIDTIPDSRILTINQESELIFAKEPLHFYEHSIRGLDFGLSFGKELLKHIPDSISVLIIPTRVGGSYLFYKSMFQKAFIEVFANRYQPMQKGFYVFLFSFSLMRQKYILTGFYLDRCNK